MLDIYAYLRKDHQVLKDLLEQIADTHDADTRRRIFTILRNAIERHDQAEEVVFYTALRATGNAGLRRQESQSAEEHAEIADFLDRLDATDQLTDRWFVLFGQLKQTLSYHIRREENDVFELARQLIPDREAYDLAMKMEMLKQQHTVKDTRRDPIANLHFFQRLFH